MKAITFFGGVYTGAEQFAEQIASVLGCRIIHDQELIETASQTHNLKTSDIEKSIYVDPPVPERFSRRKAQCIAAIKSVLAEEMKKGAAVFSGFLGTLIPQEMALHVLVTSGKTYRFQQVFREQGIVGNQAKSWLRQKDESFLRWTHYLEETDEWAPSKCHAVIASDYMEHSDAIGEIVRAVEERKEEPLMEDASIKDFELAAKVSCIMAEKGHPVAVSVHNSQAELTILKYVLMLYWHEKKLSVIASAIPGIREVRTRVGHHFYRADIYRRCEFALSSRALLRSIEKQYEDLRQRVSGNRIPCVGERRESQLISRL